MYPYQILVDVSNQMGLGVGFSNFPTGLNRQTSRAAM